MTDGRTRHYPQGRLSADDEGELAFAIAADPRRRKVILDFGTQVTWIALDPDKAEELGRLFLKKAEEARS